MPSKLDPDLVTIESWLLAAPRLTRLAFVRWLARSDPATFSGTQHLIVQQPLQFLHRKGPRRRRRLPNQQTDSIF